VGPETAASGSRLRPPSSPVVAATRRLAPQTRGRRQRRVDETVVRIGFVMLGHGDMLVSWRRARHGRRAADHGLSLVSMGLRRRRGCSARHADQRRLHVRRGLIADCGDPHDRGREPDRVLRRLWARPERAVRCLPTFPPADTPSRALSTTSLPPSRFTGCRHLRLADRRREWQVYTEASELPIGLETKAFRTKLNTR
jgi:hypothetical protein